MIRDGHIYKPVYKTSLYENELFYGWYVEYERFAGEEYSRNGYISYYSDISNKVKLSKKAQKSIDKVQWGKFVKLDPNNFALLKTYGGIDIVYGLGQFPQPMGKNAKWMDRVLIFIR